MVNHKELKEKIERNFKSVATALDTILDPNSFCNGLVICGAGGIGKSYSVIKRLEREEAAANIDFILVNASCSKLGLYTKLYQSRHKHSVLLLDDVDVWKDEDQINILKAALETRSVGEKRLVSYESTSSFLVENNIPTQFDFQGRIIFITNKNLPKIAAGKSQLADHMDAFMTRPLFVDLEIHDNESIMIHIQNVMSTTNILKDYNVDSIGNERILQYMVSRSGNMRSLSLRTAVMISALYTKFPNSWEYEADNLFLRKN